MADLRVGNRAEARGALADAALKGKVGRVDASRGAALRPRLRPHHRLLPPRDVVLARLARQLREAADEDEVVALVRHALGPRLRGPMLPAALRAVLPVDPSRNQQSHCHRRRESSHAGH